MGVLYCILGERGGNFTKRTCLIIFLAERGRRRHRE